MRPAARVVPLVLLSCLSLFADESRGPAGQPVELARAPALSPDGEFLAFEWAGDIWTVSTEGGLASRLTTHPGQDGEPHFAPSGGIIAYTSDRSGSRQIWTVPFWGGAPEQRTWHTDGYSLAGWFPDGRSFLTVIVRDHFWRHAERVAQVPAVERGADEVLFDANAESPSLSPDGRKLLYTREGVRWWRKGYRGSQSSQVWLHDLGSGEHTKLLDEEGGCRHPLWGPDGRTIYWVGARSGSFNLWTRDLDSGAERQLTFFDDDSVVFPTISRDGSTIAFRHLFDLWVLRPGKDAAPRRLEVLHDADVELARKQRRQLDQATEATFSADGLEIAVATGGDVWVLDTELREPRQVTATPEDERDLVFAPDGSALWLVSDAGGQTDIWKAERADPERYWWQQDEFRLTRITSDPETEAGLRWSPDGSRLAFVRGRGDLWTMDAQGGDRRLVMEHWSEPDFDWSPDGRWLVYAQFDDDFNRDVWIVPSDASKPAFNLSRHPDNESGPVWSPDGRLIAFSGRRVEDEVDLYFVWLREEDDRRTDRERQLEKALEKMLKERPPAKAEPAEKPAASPPAERAGGEGAEKPQGDDAKPGPTEAKKVEPVVIDFDEIHRRIRRVRVRGSAPMGLHWSPDSKELAFSATIDGRSGTWTISIPERLEPKLLSPRSGVIDRWLEKGKRILWLSAGVPGALEPNGTAADYRFSALQEVDVPARNRAAFDAAWRSMRDGWYDERLNNRNWDAIRRKYIEVAARAPDAAGLSDVVHLLLGELNGSHLGFYVRSGASAPSTDDWRPTTAHLGLRFDARHRGPGLLVRDVVPEGPADREGISILPGETVLEIDGTRVDPGLDLTTVLNGPSARDVRVMVRSIEGEERTVTIRPTSSSQVRDLLYEKWVDDNRRRVERLSDGSLGYVHVRGMNWPSFLRFEEEIYSVGAGKKGLVIDVRENGGGFTTDHLLTILTQPRHAVTVPRGGGPGYPQDRKVYASWHRPIVVLCNQNSFSNAEIFSHAIQTLGRGQVVGVPTAGGVISTGGQRILDVGFLRMPFRGWFVLGTGEDMELNGAIPDHVIWPRPGDWPAGRDEQLEKAVEVLRADVASEEARERPRLRKASERGGDAAR